MASHVLCKSCGFYFIDPEAVKPQPPRVPCPECGSTAREFRVAGWSLTGFSFEGRSQGAVTPPPEVAFSEMVTFLRTESGAWFGEIHTPRGDLVAFQITDAWDDLLLTLADDLRPPEAAA